VELIVPGPARVGAADRGFAWPGQTDVGVRWRKGEGADRGDGLIVEDGLPMRAAVSCLEDAARGRTGVIDVRLPRHAGDGADPVPNRADVAIPQLVNDWRIDLLGIR